MRILLVDDDREILFFLHEVLTFTFPGVELHLARNALEAMMVIHALAGRNLLDLVITDLQMPDATGLDICKYIKQHHPGVNIALMTGKNGSYPLFDATFFKPFDLKPIFNFISKHSRNKSSRNQ